MKFTSIGGEDMIETGFYKLLGPLFNVAMKPRDSIIDSDMWEIYTEYASMLDDIESEVTVTTSNGKTDTFPVSVASFLFGYCWHLARRLRREFGYDIEVFCCGDELCHVYNVAYINGNKVYIDSRGITDSKEAFLGIYSPYPGKAQFVDESDSRLSKAEFVEDEISDAMCNWLINSFRPFYDVAKIVL